MTKNNFILGKRARNNSRTRKEKKKQRKKSCTCNDVSSPEMGESKNNHLRQKYATTPFVVKVVCGLFFQGNMN